MTERKIEKINKALNNCKYKVLINEQERTRQYCILVKYQDNRFWDMNDNDPQDNQLTKNVMLENIKGQILLYERDDKFKNSWLNR